MVHYFLEVALKGSHPGDTYPLVTTERLRQARPGALAPHTVARSLEYLTYPADYFLLMLDRDDNPEDPTQLRTPDELLAVIETVLPGITDAGRLVTTSTSSGIRSKATGEWLLPPTGSHTYFLARGDLARFVDLLAVRLWTAGYGYCRLATPNAQTGVAAVLQRAVVDLAVFSAERLDYVAGAKIKPEAPFYQDRGSPRLSPGAVLDLDRFPDMTPDEREDYTQRLQARKAALAPERFARVTEAVRRQRPTASVQEVETIAHERLVNAEKGLLPPDFKLYFSHRTKEVTVADMTAVYDGMRLADPAEPSYREGKDAIFHWREGDWRIVSFAHGLQRVYKAGTSQTYRERVGARLAALVLLDTHTPIPSPSYAARVSTRIRSLA